MISSEKIKWQEVKGWAETHSVRSLVSYPLSKTDCVELSKYAKENSLTILPVGSSYTFGDMILNKDKMSDQMDLFRDWFLTDLLNIEISSKEDKLICGLFEVILDDLTTL